MAKVQQKSEKVTPFGGIFFVLDKFDPVPTRCCVALRNWQRRTLASFLKKLAFFAFFWKKTCFFLKNPQMLQRDGSFVITKEPSLCYKVSQWQKECPREYPKQCL